MKPLLLLTLLLALVVTAHAQDLLTKRNGDEVLVRVLEITPTEVKYRRFDNPDGPLISVWKADVFMIRYANGTKDVFNGTVSHSTPAPVVPPPPAATPPGVRPPAALPTAPPPVAPAATPTAPLAPPVPARPTGGVVVPGDEIEDNLPVSLDGPRLGFTLLSGETLLGKARERLPDLNPFLTQFGWQFEGRLFRMPNGLSGLVEFVPLVGGIEQSKFIPSLTGMLGIRGAKGFEIGMGPNVTPMGTSVVFAVGASIRSNGINFPINLAVVPGNGGARVSLLFGFNARHR